MSERLEITEAEYRVVKRPSCSLLKRVDNIGPRAILSEFKGHSEPMEFGDLVDCIMLQPEELDNKFYFEAVKKPTAQLLDLANFIIKICETRGVDMNSMIHNNAEVLEIANELSLFGSVKNPETRIKQFDNDLFWEYLQAKADSDGKTVFTPDTLDDANQAVEILRTHPKTSKLFKPSKAVEIITQLKLIGKINGHEVKGMLDLVRIDHENMTITPYDLKCTDIKQRSFMFVFMKLKYYLQASMYSSLIFDWAKIEYPDYVVNEFKFIVYSRADRYPFVWVVSDSWHNNGYHGFVDYKGNNIKGITELVDEYYYYVNNQQFAIEKEFIDNDELYIQ